MYSLIKKPFIKRVCCSGLTSLLFFISTEVLAESCKTDTCKVQVTFGGTYLEDSCDIIINNSSSSETVTLPTLSTKTLQVDGTEAGSKIFNITLKSCPINKSVSLKFISAGSIADAATGNLVNTTGDIYSQNVQIRLRNESGTQMVIDGSDSVQEYVIPSTGADVTHYYSAAYYAKGSSAVTAGKVSTMAGIVLVYK